MVRFLDNLDGALHRLLDNYINRQRPGWGLLQHGQWYVCRAFERVYERD
jgi:hypothetical protein